jgi:hypothetical protein
MAIRTTTNTEMALPSVKPCAAIALSVRKAKPTMNSAATTRMSRRGKIAADYPRLGRLTPAASPGEHRGSRR